MFARIGTWQGSPDELERWITRAREEVKPSVRQDPDLEAAYSLVDRDSGTGLIVTIWESEEAMRGAKKLVREGRPRLRQRQGQGDDEQI